MTSGNFQELLLDHTIRHNLLLTNCLYFEYYFLLRTTRQICEAGSLWFAERNQICLGAATNLLHYISDCFIYLNKARLS